VPQPEIPAAEATPPAPKPERVVVAEVSAPAPPPPAAPAPAPVAVDTSPPLVKDIEPVDIDTLTPLRNADRIRHNLEGMSINMLKEPSDTRPNGLAVINLVKFYIGEVITGTRARLIGVEGHGIGIEMIDSGERFFVAY
jgi:hypothetical protein